MSRGKIALLAGIVGFIVYIAVVVAVGDFFVNLHWTIQVVYYALTGFIWVFPAIRLIKWGARAPR
ncbi:DUF2842 domain-containing protein [Roseococcus pinisoli]|uniref:DUF2842 domain-containing protein n=1 Tax=Roseococcus pinisoli TaxID=2835040 RepID=A0ABS5QHH3_9PROT|nr:DUF2842 domain-containing protein [Roseococcus pinisoli]MBS7813139.1 DUF2842 domain-containing protein [Roseococcus pinisoli]